MSQIKKDIKFQMMLDVFQKERIEDWQFRYRIKSTAEAMRRLIDIALDQHDKDMERSKKKHEVNLAAREKRAAEREANEG